MSVIQDVYKGGRIYCDGCEKYFRGGETVAVWKDHIFHYNLPLTSETKKTRGDFKKCLTIWKLKNEDYLRRREIMIEDEMNLMRFPQNGEGDNPDFAEIAQ